MARENAYKFAIRRLSEGQIVEAVTAQERWLTQLHNGELNDMRTALLQDNSMLINDFLTGREDNQRLVIKQSLTAKAYLFVDQVYELMRIKTNSRHEFSLLRELQAGVRNLPPLSTDTADIFNYFWLCQSNEEQQHNILLSLLQQPSHCLDAAVSGLLLSLLRHFSQDKLLWLVNLALTELSDKTEQRVLTAIAIVLIKYNSRLDAFPALCNKISMLFDDNAIRQLMLKIYENIIVTAKTKVASDIIENMQSEVMSALENKKIDDDLKKLIVIDEDEELPPWLEGMKTTINQSIQQMSNLQTEGVDLNFAHFKQIRQLPFFKNDESLWLTPFAADNKNLNVDFSSELGQKVLATVEADVICDSDKYAFCLMFQQMIRYQQITSEHWELIMSQLADNAESYNSAIYARTFLQDLYRYFYLNPWQVPNEMDESFYTALPSTWLLQCLQPSMQWLQQMADIFSSAKLFNVARELYIMALERLSTAQVDDIASLGAELNQKIGYMSECVAQYDKALDAYRRADLYMADQQWTMWHIARCLSQLQQYDELLIQLDRLCELFGSKRSYLLMRANVLERLHRVDEARTVYSQLLLNDVSDLEALRRLSRNLLLDRQKQAAIEYARLAANDTNALTEDKLKYAWLLLLCGDIPAAYNAFTQITDDNKQLLSLFDADAHALPPDVLDIPRSTLNLFRDALAARTTQYTN